MSTLIPEVLKNVKFVFIFLAVLFISLSVSAQTFKLKGIFTDKTDNSALIGVVVVLTNTEDTIQKHFTTTQLEGDFLLQNLKNGSYHLKTLFTGYTGFKKDIVINNADTDLGTVKLSVESKELKEVVVVGKQERLEQKGDTTDYNANAYKVNPDATVEDLIKKMPGITVDATGAVKSQGDAVQKVLVDGKEFFGDDATMALRNLPADVVERIQTFDRASDQSQFTGFDDGNSQKTINIVTKSKNINGQFGRIYAGYGTNDRYQAGGNMNFFKGDQRISILGLANNINQQNFSSQDLLGVSSSSGGGGGGNNNTGGGRPGGGGGGGAAATNLMTGQQSGINTTKSIGLNYSDKWGKRVSFTGSYFYNNLINNTNSITNRKYFLTDTSSQLYDATTDQQSNNFNHRFNGRLDYMIDSANSILLTPVLSFQNSSAMTQVAGQNALSNKELLNKTQNGNNADNAGYTFNNSVLFRHKFKKERRTVSVNLQTSYQNKSNTTSLVSQNDYYSVTGDSLKLINQVSNTPSTSKTVGTDINYTEPIGKKSGIQVNYSPSYTLNNSDKNTTALNKGVYAFDTLLSNKYKNEVTTNRMGLSYRYRDAKAILSIGANYQNLQLVGHQEFPRALVIDKSFNNVLPNAFFNYKYSKTKNLRIMYRASTNAPSITQLQNVINNNNPLSLTTGNPDLVQEYTHNFVSRYSVTNPDKATNFMWMIGGSYTANSINNSIFTARKDTAINNEYILHKGSQLTRPVNLNGYWNGRTFLTYGLPVTKIKSNLNLNGGLTYARTPGMINSKINFSNTYAFTGGFVLGSNISPKVDFSISSTGNYTIVDNSIQPTLNNNYYYQISGVKANWLPWKGIVLGTDLTNTYYTGLAGNSFNQNFWLWNASAGYKFLKNQAAELKLSVFDLLGQNTSVSRTVANTYIEDNKTTVLTRYFMLTFTYTLKNITGSLPSPQRGNNNPPDFNGRPPRDGNGMNNF